MAILNWLNHHSDLTILFLVLIVVVTVSAAAPHIGRHVFRLRENGDREEAAFDAYKALMSMAGVVLAFSLVQANSNLRETQVHVTKLAAQIQAADRVLLRINKPQFAALRPALEAFGKSVIKDEWPRLEKGERSEATDAAYKALSSGVRMLGPEDARQQAMFNELLKVLDDMADTREEIVANSDPNDFGLSPFFWTTILLLLGVSVILAGLTKTTVARTVGLGASSAAVALMLGFLVIVDLPFQGETSVNSGSIAKALAIDAKRN
jgi:hypothetical protein